MSLRASKVKYRGKINIKGRRELQLNKLSNIRKTVEKEVSFPSRNNNEIFPLSAIYKRCKKLVMLLLQPYCNVCKFVNFQRRKVLKMVRTKD